MPSHKYVEVQCRCQLANVQMLTSADLVLYMLNSIYVRYHAANNAIANCTVSLGILTGAHLDTKLYDKALAGNSDRGAREHFERKMRRARESLNCSNTSVKSVFLIARSMVLIKTWEAPIQPLFLLAHSWVMCLLILARCEVESF